MKTIKTFNPIKRAGEIESIVMKDGKRKYYRFRHSGHYGGIITADTVGCNLMCAYCWNYFKNLHPEKYGRFYSPEEVAKNMTKIARKRNVRLLRISGAEPILGKASIHHLVKVIENVDYYFILETNGVILGCMPELINMLKGLNIKVRITIKGWDEKSFEKFTRVDGGYFQYQISALGELLKRKITAWPAFMYDIFGEEGEKKLIEKLNDIGVRRKDIEYEELIRYPWFNF